MPVLLTMKIRGVMNVTQLVTPADLQQFMIVLMEEIRSLVRRDRSEPGKRWLKSREVRQLLHISPGKLQTMRKSGTIPFTRIGGAIYYAHEDIERMFERNKSSK